MQCVVDECRAGEHFCADGQGCCAWSGDALGDGTPGRFAFAVDARGRPHVIESYSYTWSGGVLWGLVYDTTKPDGGGWEGQGPFTSSGYPYNDPSTGEPHASIALDREGYPRVCIGHVMPGWLDLAVYYASVDRLWNSSGQGVSTTAPRSDFVDCSIGVDSLDRSVVAITNTAAYAGDAGTELQVYWNYPSPTVVVPGTHHAGRYPSLAVDSQDRLHIVHVQEGDAGLAEYVLLSPTGSLLQRVPVDAVSGPFPVALTLSKNGEPLIAYHAASGDSLRLAVVRADGGMSTELIDATGSVGGYPSAAVSPDGRVHVTYYDATRGGVKYAVRELDGGWQVQPMNLGGPESAIAIDPTGAPQIVSRISFGTMLFK